MRGCGAREKVVTGNKVCHMRSGLVIFVIRRAFTLSQTLILAGAGKRRGIHAITDVSDLISCGVFLIAINTNETLAGFRHSLLRPI